MAEPGTPTSAEERVPRATKGAPAPSGRPSQPRRLIDGLLRAGRDGTLGIVGWPLVSAVLLIGSWEVASQTELVDPIILPPASEVGSALVDLVQQDFFWENAEVTIRETLIGFVIGCSIAFVLGTLIGLSRIFRYALYPYAVAFQVTPRVALAPLFLTWFGFGITSKIVMAATICFFPVLISVVVGLETVDQDARTLMRSFGASRFETYRKLSLRSSMPYLFAGLKTAMTLALIGAIVAEFVGTDEGLGLLIKTFNFQLNVADGFAVIVALMIIGLILYWIVDLIDKRVVFWRGH